ncbi:hypothetical protein [Trichlorobacter lovleyi]|uniref:hypothetical protein n=1 Tax=Trichlorobacter lovleyi TaxID=313985 RepID=UPI0023F33A1B|nr:hypothetical protein [Trichlorobacter lovleyi]
MKRNRRNLSLQACTVVAGLLLAGASPVLAGPLLVTDDAGTVDPGKVEIELNGSYGYDKGSAEGITTRTNTTDTEVKISTGLYKDLGASLTDVTALYGLALKF